MKKLENDFRSNGITNSTYKYDISGNMIYDPYKNLNIKYSSLDLPVEVTGENYTLKYTYNAVGQKLKMQEYQNGQLKNTTEYCGSFIYENGYLSYIHTETGRITITNPETFTPTYSYEHYLQDHLGNNRIVFRVENNKPVVVDENHYYPFGMLMSGADGMLMSGRDMTPQENPYQYNGKEEQPHTQYLDYGFRQYDPQLGRWHSRDKLSEQTYSQSPYSYANNNPISNIDVLGLYGYSPANMYISPGAKYILSAGTNRMSDYLASSNPPFPLFGAGMLSTGPGAFDKTYIAGVGEVYASDIIFSGSGKQFFSQNEGKEHSFTFSIPFLRKVAGGGAGLKRTFSIKWTTYEGGPDNDPAGEGLERVSINALIINDSSEDIRVRSGDGKWKPLLPGEVYDEPLDGVEAHGIIIKVNDLSRMHITVVDIDPYNPLQSGFIYNRSAMSYNQLLNSVFGPIRGYSGKTIYTIFNPPEGWKKK